MKAMLITAGIMAFISFSDGNKFLGRWETRPSPNGVITGLVVKDSTFEGYVNRKPFVTGTYTLRSDTLSFVDNGCEGKKAVYKVEFFSNEDSLRFIPIEDSCTRRKEGMLRLIMGRVK